MKTPQFRFVPSVSKVIVYSEFEVPAHFVREANDRFDDGSIKNYKLQVTNDGVRAGLLDVIYAIVKNEGLKFKVKIEEGEGAFILDAAIASENDAARTVTIGRVVSIDTPATYEKL